MIDITQYITFIISVTAIVYLPGPGVLLTSAYSLEFGFRKSLWVAIGCVFANLIHWIIVFLGIGTLISHNTTILNIIKTLGSLYIFYLGSSMIYHANRKDKKTSSSKSTKIILVEKYDNRSLFYNGFIAMFFNPKSFVFFGAILPLYISDNRNEGIQYCIYGFTFFCLGGSALVFYAALTSQFKRHTTHIFNRQVHIHVAALLLIATSLYYLFMDI